MIGRKKEKSAAESEYREVAVGPAVYTTLVVVAIVAIPLGWLNMKIGAEGSRVADTSEYRKLVAGVSRDVVMVENMLENAQVDPRVLKGAMAPAVTLITPDILPSEKNPNAKQKDTQLDVELTGIYWARSDPIVTIDGENYHVGERIQGHRIVEIRATEVVFEDPMGKKVVKNFYEDIN
jgi:hypothetical protein